MRDITRLSLKENEEWIIASDISSGIGLQEHDVLAVPYDRVGAFAARVAILEIVCARGAVKAIQYLIGGDYDTVVTSVVQGIREELNILSITVPINGSHESNMKVSTTSVGITALGIGAPEILGTGEPYAVYVLGKPLVGNEVLEQPEWIVTYDEVQRALAHPSTSRVVPVGSRGIRQELIVLSYLEGASIESVEMTDDELDHSGGPATAVVVSVRTDSEAMWCADFPKAQYVGRHR